MKNAPRANPAEAKEISALKKRIKELEQSELKNKQVADQLKESEEKYRRFFATSRDCIFITTNEGTFVDANDVAVEFFGYESREELFRVKISDLYADPEERERHIKCIKETGGTREYPVTLRKKDGTLAYTLITSNIRTDSTEKIIGFQGTIRDITESKRSKEDLQETNEFLNNLFNYANAPIITWDPQLKITRFNHAFESITGRKAEEVLGKSIEILFPPDRIERYMELIRKTLTGERWETVEIDILNVDGAIRTLLWNSATIFTYNSNIPLATIAQGYDITERKRAEEALKKRYKELNCLYGISTLMELPGISLEEILKRTAMLIPPSLQFPEISAACIILEGQTFQTACFRETPWMLSQEIVVNGGLAGDVKACYLKELEASNEGPFLIEEQHLLKAIAERVGRIIERIRAEEVLENREAELLIKSNNLEEMNITLNVLLKKIGDDKAKLEEKIVTNLSRLVFPYIDKLKKSRLSPNHITYLNIIETNLNDVISPFGPAGANAQKFTVSL
ncbi:MAG: PAS domain-containing protein [Proteobacteria bacterium]|nr:PAS domain-containing protein [Pseudomonadota bacterium]